MPQKTVQVNYRKLYRSRDAVEGPRLSERVIAALNGNIDGRVVMNDLELRTMAEPQHGITILNGRAVERNGDVFGELVFYDPGASIPLLLQNANQDGELEIRQASKPNDAEFLKGMAFFMVRQDHVLFIEQDLSLPTLERYLKWLVRHLGDSADKIKLVPHITKREDKRIDDVRNIRYKPNPIVANDLTTRNYSSVVDGSSSTKVFEILKAGLFDTVAIGGILDRTGAKLDVELKITFKVAGKQIAIEGDEAFAMLRNVPDEDLILEARGLRQNRGVLERLRMQYGVDRVGDLLVRREAWRALSACASIYREQGLLE